jgi:hypothetical protein
MGLLQRGSRRRLSMGLATVLGVARRGFFIPYRHAEQVSARPYPALEPLFAAARPVMTALLDDIAYDAPTLAAMTGPAPRPRIDQAWFPRLDAAAAYAIVRARRPARIVEIGSGHSTRFLCAAVMDGGQASSIACIDPAPRAALAGLPVDWHQSLLQDAPPALFTALQAGDILFVDSSHILMPGSDVDLILGQVLPALAKGVLLHFHDIFLPDAYPANWAWRGYNEQSALAGLLQGGAFRLLFASHYASSRMPETVGRAIGDLPDRYARYESSLWLEKTA